MREEEKGLLDKAGALLGEGEIVLTVERREALWRHVCLVREWSRGVSLVSMGDLDELVQRHVVDSLSLACAVKEGTAGGGTWLDIGSGGGFPAIPVKVVLPEAAVTLLEGSVKKVGFLRKSVGALGLEGVKILNGRFPDMSCERRVGIVTARAVEKPERIVGGLLELVKGGATYLCQMKEVPVAARDTFHVEQVVDKWSRTGLRRGSLWRITARQ